MTNGKGIKGVCKKSDTMGATGAAGTA